MDITVPGTYRLTFKDHAAHAGAPKRSVEHKFHSQQQFNDLKTRWQGLNIEILSVEIIEAG